MPGKFRYRVEYKIVRRGSIEVQADNDMAACDIVEEALDDGDLQPDSSPELEVGDVECLDKGRCSKCGEICGSDLLSNLGGVCRHCVMGKPVVP